MAARAKWLGASVKGAEVRNKNEAKYTTATVFNNLPWLGFVWLICFGQGQVQLIAESLPDPQHSHTDPRGSDSFALRDFFGRVSF